MAQIIIDVIHPPQGHWIRKLIILMAIGLSYSMLYGNRHVPIGLLDNREYGLLFGFIALWMAGSYDYRRHWWGRLAAVAGATVFGLLAWDTGAASTVSAVVNGLMAYCCIGEAGFTREC